MVFDEQEMTGILKKIAMQANISAPLPLESVKYIAGFDVIFLGNQMVCAAAVLDYKTLTVVERKHSLGKALMPYIAGFRAFRDGPAIIQTYYDLEHEPDLIFIPGHGIAHPQKCGVATYVGVELQKPTIGIAKALLHGEINGSNIVINNEVCGEMVRTREHAKPLFVSPGNMLTLTDAVSVTKYCIIPPHKLPEPLHAAHKTARKILSQLLNGTPRNEENDEEELPEEYRVDSAVI